MNVSLSIDPAVPCVSRPIVASQVDPQQKLRSNRAGCCALAMYRTDIGLCIESRFIAVEPDLGGQSPLKTNGSSAAPALRTSSCASA
jgi:hypothetical protein